MLLFTTSPYPASNSETSVSIMNDNRVGPSKIGIRAFKALECWMTLIYLDLNGTKGTVSPGQHEA